MQNGGLRIKGIHKNSQLNKPLITVITVVFNGVDSLVRTIESVIEQTYENIEYIIIDGASTDGTINILKQYEDKIDYWQSEPDKGIYDAMNKAITLASGDWINFMNAGDVFVDKNVISCIFNNNSYTGIDVLFGDSIEINNNTERKIVCSSNSNDILKHPTYRHGASFIRASIHKKNMFDLSRNDLGFALDYYLIYSLKRKKYLFKKVDVCIMKYEKEGISSNVKKSALYNFRITFYHNPIYACIRFIGVNIKRILGLYK